MATNLEFIKSASGSSVSSLSVTDCFSDKYDVYFVSISKMDNSVASYTNGIRVINTSGVDTGSNYYVASLELRANLAFQTRQRNPYSQIDYVWYSNTTARQKIGHTFYVYNPFDSSSYTFFTAQSSFMDVAGTYMEGYKTVSVLKSAEQCNGIQLNAGVGQLDNITVNIIRVK